MSIERYLEENVIMLGARSDVNDGLNAFDLFLMLSKFEGLEIALIEAQANGLPCIFSKDVIPEEADVHGGMIKRVLQNASPDSWAKDCILAGRRKNATYAQQAVKLATYDIN